MSRFPWPVQCRASGAGRVIVRDRTGSEQGSRRLAERAQRKFAVQKPKPGLKQGARPGGSKAGASQWETIALVDTLDQGQAEFADAVRINPGNFVRLIQVDFVGSTALADYDWHLIELHDPLKGRRRGPDGNVVSLAARRKAKKKPTAGNGTSNGAFSGWGDEPAPRDRRTLIAFLLFAAAAVAVWLFVGQI